MPHSYNPLAEMALSTKQQVNNLTIYISSNKRSTSKIANLNLLCTWSSMYVRKILYLQRIYIIMCSQLLLVSKRNSKLMLRGDCNLFIHPQNHLLPPLEKVNKLKKRVLQFGSLNTNCRVLRSNFTRQSNIFTRNLALKK